MRTISVNKVTLNFGAGKDQQKLEKGIKLMGQIAGKPPVKTYAQKRIQEWGLRPGLAIGCKITLRNKDATAMAKRLLEAKDFSLTKRNFDNEGNVSFGIAEYIDIPQVKYDPKLGIMGIQVCITLQRPGFRVKYRSVDKKKLPAKQRIPKEESIEFMKKHFNVTLGE